MSDTDQPPLPALAAPLHSELEALIQRVVQRTVAQLGQLQPSPFINSKSCAELLGVSPEHLCAMRAHGEGPPWSGEGKWIRYLRNDVLSWLGSLPTRLSKADEQVCQTENRSN
jgi:hypothetical protein